MDGVKRYIATGVSQVLGGEFPAHERFVFASDYDATLAREAALRSENERLELLVKDFQWGASVEAQAGDEARRELAALREELAEAQRVLSFSGNEADAHSTAALHTELEDTHERLTAAEQRNAELTTKTEYLTGLICGCDRCGGWTEDLKPTESGAVENVAADSYWAISDAIGTEDGWSVLEHVQWMRELLIAASDFLHDIPETSVGGNSSIVELCRRIRLCIDGKAPGYLPELSTESGASE